MRLGGGFCQIENIANNSLIIPNSPTGLFLHWTISEKNCNAHDICIIWFPLSILAIKVCKYSWIFLFIPHIYKERPPQFRVKWSIVLTLAWYQSNASSITTCALLSSVNFLTLADSHLFYETLTWYPSTTIIFFKTLAVTHPSSFSSSHLMWYESRSVKKSYCSHAVLFIMNNNHVV